MEVVAPIRTARTQAPSVMLRDALARPLVSLRLSVTDRCNLRCMYCMPEKHYQWLPQDHLLSSEELVRLVDIFTVFGVRRLRLTGGEPLLLRDLDGLVTLLAANPLIEDLALTTNGILLAEQAGALHRAGLHRVTISLDTLRPERFLAITRRDDHARVLDGIAAARRVCKLFLRMEETCTLRRIDSEGRGMSASTQEYDMNTKQLFAGTAVATVLALASPAYAGLLGGAGGLGGTLDKRFGGKFRKGLQSPSVEDLWSCLRVRAKQAGDISRFIVNGIVGK